MVFIRLSFWIVIGTEKKKQNKENIEMFLYLRNH